MENNDWNSIADALPNDNRQVDFYTLAMDELCCGFFLDNRWYDETMLDANHRPIEIIGVTHWRERPKNPFAS